jgi:hypothetical protein
MTTAKKAFRHLIERMDLSDVILDIGCGKNAPFTREVLSWNPHQTIYTTDIVDISPLGPNHKHITDDILPWYTAPNIIWCSHVMEHLLDIDGFINRLSEVMEHSKAILYLTVPPMKPELVGGHLTLWTPLLLCYNFIVRGWDLSEAELLVDTYDITLITKFKQRPYENLVYDSGDIETLSTYFPCGVYQGVNGFDLSHDRLYKIKPEVN